MSAILARGALAIGRAIGSIGPTLWAVIRSSDIKEWSAMELASIFELAKNTMTSDEQLTWGAAVQRVAADVRNSIMEQLTFAGSAFTGKKLQSVATAGAEQIAKLSAATEPRSPEGDKVPVDADVDFDDLEGSLSGQAEAGDELADLAAELDEDIEPGAATVDDIDDAIANIKDT